MKAYDIATIKNHDVPEHSIKNSLKAVQVFMEYVAETDNPIVKGLVSMMAEEIQHQRLDGRVYLGSNSIDLAECANDSKYLLSRVLLDRSSHGTPPGYVEPQLENTAWDIATVEGGRDSLQNWLMAERRYVKSGLEYLANLQKEAKSVQHNKAN